ncbi:outer membrane protein assembly factor BamA [bacterium]|nr:outer membrane protein assembly factor BamA [bacterium]
MNGGRWIKTSLFLTLIMLCSAEALAVKADSRYVIDEVEIEGNEAFSDSRLYKVMLSRPSSIFHKYYYYRSILTEDIRQLTNFYQSNGYLEATFDPPTVKTDSSNMKVTITLKVREGNLTRIEGITMFGNEIIPDDSLLARIKIKVGDPLVRRKNDNANVSILRMYADRGYLDATVEPDVRVDSVAHLALIDFNIHEAKQYTIGEIRFEGNEITRHNVVRRELRFKSGQTVVYSKLLQTQRNLYLTGLFQSVFVRPVVPQSQDSTLKDVVVEVRENLPKEFSVAAGYGSLERLRGKLELFNTNLAGTARKIGMTGRLSLIHRAVEGQFTDPYTFGTPWRTDFSVSTLYKKEPGYEIYTTGGRLTVGHVFLKKSRITFTYRHETSLLRNVRVAQIPEELDTRIRSFRQSVLLDTRDNLFNPKRGSFLEWSNELAGAFLEGTNTFVRTGVTGRYYLPWGTKTVFATGMQAGWMNSTGGGLTAIPLNERYYAGGPNNLRGFDYQKVGPLDPNRNPIGGRVLLVANLIEARRTIYKWFGAALFFDMGNVWASTSDFDPVDLRYSPGVGLRVDSPIGLARVDLGLNVDPLPGEDSYKVYFSIGQAF